MAPLWIWYKYAIDSKSLEQKSNLVVNPAVSVCKLQLTFHCFQTHTDFFGKFVYFSFLFKLFSVFQASMEKMNPMLWGTTFHAPTQKGSHCRSDKSCMLFQICRWSTSKKKRKVHFIHRKWNWGLNFPPILVCIHSIQTKLEKDLASAHQKT